MGTLSGWRQAPRGSLEAFPPTLNLENLDCLADSALDAEWTFLLHLYCFDEDIDAHSH